MWNISSLAVRARNTLPNVHKHPAAKTAFQTYPMDVLRQIEKIMNRPVTTDSPSLILSTYFGPSCEETLRHWSQVLHPKDSLFVGCNPLDINFTAELVGPEFTIALKMPSRLANTPEIMFMSEKELSMRMEAHTREVEVSHYTPWARDTGFIQIGEKTVSLPHNCWNINRTFSNSGLASVFSGENTLLVGEDVIIKADTGVPLPIFLQEGGLFSQERILLNVPIHPYLSSHIDDFCLWLDPFTLLISDFKGQSEIDDQFDAEFNARISDMHRLLEENKREPVRVIRIPYCPTWSKMRMRHNVGSYDLSGLYIQSVVTPFAIYVPQYEGDLHLVDALALDAYKAAAKNNKPVIGVASGHMSRYFGGGLHSLTTQLSGCCSSSLLKALKDDMLVSTTSR